MLDGLWGEEFVVSTPEKTKKIINKISKPKEPKVVVEKQIKSKKLSITDRLALITENVLKILGKYKEKTLVIKDKQTFVDYIDVAIKNGRIAIDTETNNSLDPITCKIMGLCLYTPGMKQAYIPVNHVNYQTGERLSWQLTEEDINEQLLRILKNNVKEIYHNGKFDYQVIKCTCKVEMDIYWDTMIASKIIDENERSAKLKHQYISKIDPEQEKYDIEHLFENVEYAWVDPEIFALYAATDSFMTDELHLYQKAILDLPENKNLYSLFRNVEIPVIQVLAEMELNGMEVDQEYAALLSAKYHNILNDIDSKINAELDLLKPKIDAWRLTSDANEKTKSRNGEMTGKSKNEQLEDPINLASPTQLAILLYDILKVKAIDKKTPRGTGEEILKKIDLPVTKYIIERREVVKLLTTYIDVIPELAKRWPDGRVRTHFNQYGAATGRLSSSDPINFQNIPSHNKEIRMLFKARDGYTMVGSDFSQQEPRLLSQYSQDENMINAYKQGKDLYATIAMGVYKNGYWDNMEKHEDGTPNPDGKKRRSNCKSLLLGIMYGRGVASIAEQTKSTIEEAQKIIDDFYKGFPKVKTWTEETQEFAKKNGYVEDLWGRRRRLPDITLPKYQIKDLNKTNILADFNPFLGCSNRVDNTSSKLIESYSKQLSKVKNRKDYEVIKDKALKENIEIHDNSGFIAQAERQCVNARIQGGAATMTKISMIKIYHDKELNDLGFKLLVNVHDELIGECPAENADKVAERLCYVMRTSVEDVCQVPFKCDPDISTCWYLNDFQDVVRQEFTDLLVNYSKEEAFEIMAKIRTESTVEQLKETLCELL